MRLSLRFLTRSLFARLLIYFVLLAVIPLAIVGAIAYYQGQRTLRENILDHLTTTAILKEEEINRWVEAMEQDVRLLGADPTVRQWAQILLVDPGVEATEAGPGSEGSAEAYQALHAYLDRVLVEKSDFLEILLLRAVGGEVALSTNGEHEGTYEVTSSFFTEGRKSTYVQNIYPSVSLGEPAMTVATPIVNEQEETVGVLAVHLDLAQLDAIMLERGGLGETGETYLVDQFNVFVSEARFGQETFPRGVHTEGIDTALLDKEDGAGVYLNYRDVPVIGAYRWLDERGIALLAEVELSEALAPTRQLASTILLVTGLVTLAVGIAAYGVTRQISQPLLQMAEVSTDMAAGNLDRAVMIRREDEIGTLARAFNGMASQLRDLIGGLEQRVAERTHDLEQRAIQLATAAEVGRAAASILDLDALLPRVVELIRERFGLYYAGLFLVDDAGDYAVLQAGTGEAGEVMKRAGHQLAIGGRSMVGRACSEREARIALDVGAERVRFDNPLLPDTRSEMALPLLVGDRVLGALDVQSTEAAAFSEADIAVLQLMADQVAVAVDNARKFSEEAGLLEATSPLYRISHRLAKATTIDEVSQAILSIVAETEADGCSVAQFDRTPDGEIAATSFLSRWDRHGLPRRFPTQMSVAVGDLLPIPLVTRLTAIEDVQQDSRIPEDARAHLAEFGVQSLITVPLRVASAGRIQGFLAISRQTPGTFSPVTLRLYETLAEQAAVALERARLLEASQHQAWREHHIRDISDRITSSFDMEQLMRTTVEELGAMIGAAGGYVEMAPLMGDGPREARRQPAEGTRQAAGDIRQGGKEGEKET